MSQEIPDIFIPPTPIGNAGVIRGRNENSGMTTGGTTGGDDKGERQGRNLGGMSCFAKI